MNIDDHNILMQKKEQQTQVSFINYVGFFLQTKNNYNYSGVLFVRMYIT